MAAVLAAGEGAALSNEASAHHWNIWRRKPRPHRRDHARPATAASRHTIHGAEHSSPRDVTRYRGIPITTVPRTLVDLATTLTAAQLANVIHEAAFRNRFSAEETREA